MTMAGIIFILQLCVQLQVFFSIVVTDKANLTSVLEAGVTADTEGTIFQSNSTQMTFLKNREMTSFPQPNPPKFPGELTPEPPPDPQLPSGDLTPPVPSEPQPPPGDLTPPPPPDPWLLPDVFTPPVPPDYELPPGELTPPAPSDSQLPPGDLTPPVPPDYELPPGDILPPPPPPPPDPWLLPDLFTPPVPPDYELPPGDLLPPPPPPPPDPWLLPDLFTPPVPPDYELPPGELTPPAPSDPRLTPAPPPSLPVLGGNKLGDKNKQLFYIWDKEKMSAKDFQLSYCSWRCRNGETRYINQIFMKCPTVDCFPCSCEKPACEIYDNCCPDISEPVFTLRPSEQVPDSMATLSHGNVPELSMETDNISKDKGKNSTLFGENSGSTEVVTTEASYDYVPTPVCNTNGHFNFFYIRSCPRNFDNQTVVQLCEGEVAEEELKIDYKVRVYDESTSVTYYNQYCAICNGVTQTQTWQTNIACDHYMFVYQATTMEEFVSLAIKPRSGCGLDFELPNKDAEFHYCPGYFDSETIDRCNTTGHWQYYDPDVLQACEGPELSSRIHSVIANDSEPVNYKNIFCAICNTGEYPDASGCDGTKFDKRNNGYNPPFSVLLGFSRQEEVEDPFVFKRVFSFRTCDEDEWSAPDGSCLPLHCSPGKTFSDGMCPTALGDIIRGLGYRLRVWFVVDGGEDHLIPGKVSQKEISGIFLSILFEMSLLFEPLGPSTEYILDSGFIYNKSQLLTSDGHTNTDFSANRFARSISDIKDAEESSSGADAMSLHFWIDGVVQADLNTTRDDFETLIADTFLNNETNVDVMGQFNLTLKPHVIAYDHEKREHCSEALSFNPNMYCDIQKMVSSLKYFSVDSVEDANKFLNVTNVLNCRYVRFNSTQYDMETDRTVIPPHTTVRIDLNVTVVNISDQKDLNMITVDSNGHLLVCNTLLDEKLTEIEEDRRRKFTAKLRSTLSSDDSSKGQYILTLVCMGASMLCLLLTLVTYFRFSVLRSVAGRNNIFLCGSLLLAQASLLATSHVEGPDTLCTAIGISTHFLWLCMFCWSFICCFHMFRVFTTKTRNSRASSHSNMMLLVRNIALSLLFPSLVVVAVVLGSYFTSHGHQIGYGDNACYLDSAMLVGISTVAPLALVTLCNIIFFMVTIIKIHNIRKLQQSAEFKKDDRRDMYIYIKLSTMTGAFWTIFIVAEAVDVDALRYIAIVLNGLQGVFIFMSYICNKRVVNMYLSSWGRAPLTTTSTERHAKTGQSILGKPPSQIYQKTEGKESENIPPQHLKTNGSLQASSGKPYNDFDDIDNKEEAEQNGRDASFSSHGYHSDTSGHSDDKNNVYAGDDYDEKEEKPEKKE